MIMADRPFQVGDRVSFGGQYGDVTAIGLRSVRVRTLDDSVVTIPNNLFLTDVTTCGNYGVLHMQLHVDLYIGIIRILNWHGIYLRKRPRPVAIFSCRIRYLFW